MSKTHDDFLIQRNIDRFTRLLETEDDAKKRATLSQLLEEERAKQDNSPPDPDAYLRG